MTSCWTLHQGDCLDVLKTLPDNSVDSVVTDPPYGLSNHDAGDVREALRCWLDGKPYAPKGKGFMGKGWDAFVPGPEVWRECLRVLKPGGHLLVFAGTRTQDLMGIAVRLSGFDARDSIIAHGMLHWTYGSGFPKNLDVSKAIDKMSGAEREKVGSGKGRTGAAAQPNGGSVISDDNYQWPGEFDITAPATEAAKQWNGWGSALKPSQEPILVFRKPLIGTVAANVLAHGTGAINIDGCRVGTSENLNGGAYAKNGTDRHEGSENGRYKRDGGAGEFIQPSGRWPTNTLLCHTPDCRQAGTAKITGDSRTGGGTRPGGFGNVGTKNGDGAPCSPGYADPEGTETVTAWDCADGCPVKGLNAQSGELQGRGNKTPTKSGVGMFSVSSIVTNDHLREELKAGGGASRFYPQFTYGEDDNPFLYMGKAATRERNEGLDHFPKLLADPYAQHRGRRMEDQSRFDGKPPSHKQNMHPTVKPIALMRWLTRLVTPPGGTVLDPFNGSGTTGCASILEGFQYIGIEREPEYVEIARARITHHLQASQGGVKNPWEGEPAPKPEPVTTPTPETAPITLDDLFGF